jgi:hypothetical protein
VPVSAAFGSEAGCERRPLTDRGALYECWWWVVPCGDAFGSPCTHGRRLRGRRGSAVPVRATVWPETDRERWSLADRAAVERQAEPERAFRSCAYGRSLFVR